MLPGRCVNVRRAEKRDIPLLTAWACDIDMNGEFESFHQLSESEFEKEFEADPDLRWYIAEDKGGEAVGCICHGKCGGGCWIGYQVVPAARRRGYGTEMVRLIVDYLFMHKDIGRIQAETHPANDGSRRILEKAGFTFEGLIRRSYFSRGTWRDTAMYSLLREEWAGPRILPPGAPPA